MQETVPLGRAYKYHFLNRLVIGCCCVQETKPLGRTYKYNLEIAFKRTSDVCRKQCLWVGLIGIIFEIPFQRASAVCKKQCL